MNADQPLTGNGCSSQVKLRPTMRIPRNIFNKLRLVYRLKCNGVTCDVCEREMSAHACRTCSECGNEYDVCVVCRHSSPPCHFTHDEPPTLRAAVAYADEQGWQRREWRQVAYGLTYAQRMGVRIDPAVHDDDSSDDGMLLRELVPPCVARGVVLEHAPPGSDAVAAAMEAVHCLYSWHSSRKATMMQEQLACTQAGKLS